MNLKTRMAIAIFLLFGLLFAIMMGVVYYFYYVGAIGLTLIIVIPLILAIVIILAQWGLSPYLIKWIYKIRWVDGFTPNIDRYIDRVCMEQNIVKPKLGIVEDDNPNAFCFGWTRNKSFMVLTRGIMKYCDEDEQKAVAAHEIGHIAHNDFVVMTIVAAIPLIFYVIFRGAYTFIRYGSRGGGSSKGKGQAVMLAAIVMVVSYIVYLLSQLIALLVSRYREYWADEFSAETTTAPDKLSSALVKIAYGLAIEGLGEKSEKGHRKYENAFMIFNAQSARALASKASDRNGVVNKENIKKAMAWDLWTTWAFFLELQTTHPLPAKRIKALDDYAKANGMKTYIDFDLKKPEAYWDDFLIDIFMASLWVFSIPIAILMALYLNILVAIGGFLFLFAFFILIYFFTFKYPLNFGPSTVDVCLGDIKASPVRGRSVQMKGKIIGRGIPGLFFSEDLKLDDGTGLILLDYHQISRFIDLLVGIFATQDKIGKDVEVLGWYRRRIIPYVEIYKMKIDDRWKQIYTLWAYYAALFILMIVGLIIIYVGYIFL